MEYTEPIDLSSDGPLPPVLLTCKFTIEPLAEPGLESIRETDHSDEALALGFHGQALTVARTMEPQP